MIIFIQQSEVLAFYDSLTVLLNLVKDNKQRIFMHSDALVRFINEVVLHVAIHVVDVDDKFDYYCYKAKLKGISRTIRFDRISAERYHPTLYNVLDIGPSTVTKVSVCDEFYCSRQTDRQPIYGGVFDSLGL